MKKSCAIVFAILYVLISATVINPGNAETTTRNITLKHFDVTVTFPKTADPGQSILISMIAEAKSSIKVKDLSIQILAYVESGDLQSIGSVSLASDQQVHKGDKLQKELSVTISTSSLRGALVTIVSETIVSTTYTYYSYPYYYYYDYSYYYYPYYYPYYYAYYYPDTYTQEYVESKALAGTYVLASTPEYVKLKSDYDNLSSQYSELSVKYQQVTEQNTQLSDKVSTLSQELSTTRILAFIFVAATVILAAYLLYAHRRMHPVTGASLSSNPTAEVSSRVQPEKASATLEKKEMLESSEKV